MASADRGSDDDGGRCPRRAAARPPTRPVVAGVVAVAVTSLEEAIEALKQRRRDHMLEIRDLNNRIFGIEEAIDVLEHARGADKNA